MEEWGGRGEDSGLDGLDSSLEVCVSVSYKGVCFIKDVCCHQNPGAEWLAERKVMLVDL